MFCGTKGLNHNPLRYRSGSTPSTPRINPQYIASVAKSAPSRRELSRQRCWACQLTRLALGNNHQVEGFLTQIDMQLTGVKGKLGKASLGSDLGQTWVRLGSDLNGINFSVSHWLSSSLRSSALGLVMSLYFFGRRFLTLGSYRQGRFGRSTNVVNSLPSRAA